MLLSAGTATGLGYATGSSTTRMLGEYIIIDSANNEVLATVEDPVSVDHEIGGLIGNLRISIKLGVLKLHVDYNFQEYNSLTAGFQAGF